MKFLSASIRTGLFRDLTLASFLILTLVVPGRLSAQSSRTQDQMEITVVHVDQFAVYGPNLVFYWDPAMNKQKISALSGIAERLRNKKALVTYSTASDTTGDKRMIVVDIAPAGREPSNASSTSPPPEVQQQKPQSSTLDKDSVKAPTQEASSPEPPLQSFSKTEIVTFIKECMDAVEKKDINRSLACYEDQVDYYTKGPVNRDFIKKDKGYYFRAWDRIRSWLDGDVVVIVIDQPDLRIAKFISGFDVENAKVRITGRAENIWKIRKAGNQLRIVDEKQRVIERTEHQ